MSKDFQEEYNRISELQEQNKAKITQCRIDFNCKMDNIVDHYVANAGDLNDEEIAALKQRIYNDCEKYRSLYWKNLDVEANPELQYSMGEDNSDREYQMKNILKIWPEVADLDDVIVQWWKALRNVTEYQEELEELLHGTQEQEEPVIDASTEISNIQQKTEKQVEEVTQTPPADGHVYPVALVQSWTNEMKNYNDQLTNYLGMMSNINFDKVDRNWLKKQVLKFVSWLKTQLNKLKQKVINGLKGMMQPIKKAMGLVSPILSLPTDPLAILGWAGNVVSIFTEPYTKIIQFITDFTTYTPPLVGAAASLSANVATAPVKIIAKANELKGEGSEIIQEEIANAVQGLIFEAPGLGDLM